MYNEPIESVESADSEKEYKKRELKRRKRIDQLKSKAGSNSVLAEVSGGSDEKKKYDEGKWSLVQEVCWAAREAYVEKDNDFETVIEDLKSALDSVVEICKKDYKADSKESKEYNDMKELAKS